MSVSDSGPGKGQVSVLGSGLGQELVSGLGSGSVWAQGSVPSSGLVKDHFLLGFGSRVHFKLCIA